MLQGWYTINWEAFVAGASSRELLGGCSVARAPKPFSALAPSETGARTGVGGACRLFATTFSATTVGVTGTGELWEFHTCLCIFLRYLCRQAVLLSLV